MGIMVLKGDAMTQQSGFGKKLLRYFLLLISFFSFFVSALHLSSYWIPALRVYVWSKNLTLLLSIILVSAIIWIITTIAYIFTE